MALVTELGMRFCVEKSLLLGYFSCVAINLPRGIPFPLPGAHHIDLRSSTEEDPEWLTSQRASEVNLIRGWINDYYEERRAAPGEGNVVDFAASSTNAPRVL